MQTKYLLSFLSAAKARSISKASISLNYAQSTIYEHISSLENELGTELYKRTSRGLELTDAGRLLSVSAEKIIELWEMCGSEITGARNGQIRICASESISKYYLYGLLSEFMRKCPDVGIDFNLVPGAVSVERIISGTCDIALHFGVTPPIKGVAATKLFSANMIFAVHPAHSFARCRKRPGTIQREILVSNLDAGYIMDMLKKAGLEFDKLFSSYIRAGGVDLAKSFALDRNGVTLLPEMALRGEIEDGKLCPVDWLDAGITQDAYMLTPEKKFFPQHVRELAALAIERCKASPPDLPDSLARH